MEFKSEDTILNNRTWTAPKAKNQEFSVYVWGGGGAGSCASFNDPVSGGGGGAGYMNFGTFTINEGTRVDVKIGSGGIGCDGISPSAFANSYIGESGGTTVFGNYIFALGGEGGNGNKGGQGGYPGGDAGLSGYGNYGSYGINGAVENISYMSGGGGSAINARGLGGSANRTLGDGGTAAGGAGAFCYRIGESSPIHRRTGNGGQGACIIKYTREV